MHAFWLIIRRLCQDLICVALCLSLSSLAIAQTPIANEPRLALVIGNAAYRNSPLTNPVNDARLMETALKNAGFQVLKAENTNRRDMQRLIRDFGEKLKRSGGVGLFYFAGHGMQVRGNNYLIPLDADIRSEDEVAFDSIDAQSVLEKMESAGNRVNLLILDACRDNPFIRNSRSAAVGLATMSAPSGSLIAYSTAPGAVANDGTGRNGLYTEHLARMMAEPRLPVEDVFKQVRVAVRRASNNQQTPWENTALEGRFYFNYQFQKDVALESVVQQSNRTESVAADIAFWDSIKGASKPAELQAYLAQFPNGTFAGLARSRLPDSQMSSAGTPLPIATRIPVPTPTLAATPTVMQLTAPTSAAPPVPNPASLVVSSMVPASEPRAAVQLATSDELILRDRLTGLERQRIRVAQIRLQDGGVRYSTGDDVAVDGQVRAARMGTLVASVQNGALWKFPLKVGTTGSAKVTIDDTRFPGEVNWRVTRNDHSVAVEAIVEYSENQNSQQRRYGTWTGQYREAMSIAASHKLDFRQAIDRVAFAMQIEMIDGELMHGSQGVSSATTATIPGAVKMQDTPQTTSAPHLVAGDRLTYRLREAISGLNQGETKLVISSISNGFVGFDDDSLVMSAQGVLIKGKVTRPTILGLDVLLLNTGNRFQAKFRAAERVRDVPVNLIVLGPEILEISGRRINAAKLEASGYSTTENVTGSAGGAAYYGAPFSGTLLVDPSTGIVISMRIKSQHPMYSTDWTLIEIANPSAPATVSGAPRTPAMSLAVGTGGS